MFANGAYQPLGKDAVERGNKIVSFHSHIEKTSQHVDHVVGMDGGEHQVTGQRGVDGNLCCFLVADFAHQDLVRVMAQNGAQAAGEGKALLLVNRDLSNAANLVLDRVLDGDDLVFVALDLVQGRVKRRGLAG